MVGLLNNLWTASLTDEEMCRIYDIDPECSFGERLAFANLILRSPNLAPAGYGSDGGRILKRGTPVKPPSAHTTVPVLMHGVFYDTRCDVPNCR